MADDPVIYSVDSSALIHGWRRAYPPENFPTIWDRLDALIATEQFLICDEVLFELKRKDDDLHDWCRERLSMVVEVDDHIQNEMVHLMGTYPKLVDTSKGKSSADPFVIALAKTRNPRLTVVTEEGLSSKKRPRIPYVCSEEGVRCINLLGLIQEQKWVIGA